MIDTPLVPDDAAIGLDQEGFAKISPDKKEDV